MNIQWFGQSCFRIETKDSSILIDPFSKEIGLTTPRFHDTIILVTHDHYDHNSVKEAADAMVINSPGEYEKQGVFIQGIQSFHDQVQGAQRGPNVIYFLEAEDMSVCHMGDFGQEELDQKQLEVIQGVDVLMIPIGGIFTIDGKQASKIVAQIQPKIIVPMHYKVSGLKIDLEGPDKFLKEISLPPEKIDKLKISKKNLPVEEMKLILFQL